MLWRSSLSKLVIDFSLYRLSPSGSVVLTLLCPVVLGHLCVLWARFLKSAKSLLLVHVLSSFQNLLFLPLFPLPLDRCIFMLFYKFYSVILIGLWKGTKVFVLFPSLLWWKFAYLNESIYTVFISNQKLNSANKY